MRLHASRPYARLVGGSDVDRIGLDSFGDREPPRAGRAPAPVERLASRMGNRAFTQAIARMGDGEGILSGGVVHPDVETAIAARRGSGAPLPAGLSERFAGALGGPVDDVRVHTDAGAGALARAVSARAFATGSDIFFADGEYRPGTSSGDALIAHEVAHTEQQRGAPPSGPLTVSEPGEALEREADAAARDLLG